MQSVFSLSSELDILAHSGNAGEHRQSDWRLPQIRLSTWTYVPLSYNL